MKNWILAFSFFLPVQAFCQSTLTIEKIMQDPKWIGTSPSSPFWSVGSDTLFFEWNPEKAPSDSIYFITLKNHNPQKASPGLKTSLIADRSVRYNTAHTAMVFAHDGDIFYKSLKRVRYVRITETADMESNPVFSFDGKKVVYQRGDDLYAWDIVSGQTSQLTRFMNSKPVKPMEKLTEEEKWLQDQQTKYMQVLRERKEKADLEKAYNEAHKVKDNIPELYSEGKPVFGLSISPDGRSVAYKLFERPKAGRATIVPNYITESGYTSDIPGRQKVGEPQSTSSLFVYDFKQDTMMKIPTDSLEGIRQIPEFYKDYPKEYERMKKEDKPKYVTFGFRSEWSADGRYLLTDIFSIDNKDRWIVLWDAYAHRLIQADHQHDEAWIGGPGMYGSLGWIDDNTIYFQSEKTGYSHLYTYDVKTNQTRALTSGNYEVQSTDLSPDKKFFYITTNETDPEQKQFYRLRISDGKQERLTTMTGGNKVTVSPDGKQLAILYSFANKPWELYLQKSEPGSKAEQITDKAMSDEWKAYPWRVPDFITFEARDGAQVHARLFKPANAKPGAPAVVFVHGAGYLQNAHRWWSDAYFREYMFDNFLADHGYYVIDADYRGSAGYGRDWRTGIYRHMGGKDLNDNVDAANYLVKTFGVDPHRIGIFGGSYGGFITLMAMFTTPDVFAAGAGLRSVTEWDNYNHGYTSDILNEPYNDSIAYHRSSPIYFAEGLKGHLLMCHGIVDQNVHVQDIIKLTQRLIELKKENWQLALFPMENHGFEEPTSWMDEYKRIFNLFETVLKK